MNQQVLTIVRLGEPEVLNSEILGFRLTDFPSDAPEQPCSGVFDSTRMSTRISGFRSRDPLEPAFRETHSGDGRLWL